MDFGPRDILVAATVFALILAVWLIAVVLWSRRRLARAQQVQDRLGLGTPHSADERVLRLWHDGNEATTTVHGRRRVPWRVRLELAGRRAGWSASMSAIVAGVAAVAVVLGAALWYATNNLLVGALSGVAVAMVFRAYVQHRITARTILFETQFLDALEIAVRSLRAGHPLIGAFRFIAEEIPSPVGAMFSGICQEQSLGMSLEEAIRKAGAESTSPDMKVFATSVVVQLHSGGQLADMMERLAAVTRDRLRLSSRARVLMAQTQMSKQILVAFPFVLFLVLSLLNPAYMDPLYTSFAGKMILGGAGLLLLVGVWTMNRLAVVRY